jgi:hypothetical protein
MLHRDGAAFKKLGALAHEEALAASDRGYNASGKWHGEWTARAAGRAPAPERVARATASQSSMSSCGGAHQSSRAYPVT